MIKTTSRRLLPDGPIFPPGTPWELQTCLDCCGTGVTVDDGSLTGVRGAEVPCACNGAEESLRALGLPPE